MRGFRYFLVAFFITLSIAASATYAHAQAQVVLGNASVALTGPWKFHTGDNMAWTNPKFDDSSWSTMDLTPPSDEVDPLGDKSGAVPGWTARGFAGYSGYAWYRMRVNIVQQNATDDAKQTLSFSMPDEFDSPYQVYVDGQLIGQFGRFAKHAVTYYYRSPRVFPWPANARSGLATIAIRTWMDVSTPLLDSDTGGLRRAPVLGQTSVIRGLLHLEWYLRDRVETSIFLGGGIELLALLVAFGLYGLDRGELAYLWLGLMCMDSLFYAVLVLIGNYTTWIAGPSVDLLRESVSAPVGIGLGVLFWGYWFRLGHTGRMARFYGAVWGLVLLLGIGRAMQSAPLYGRFIPAHAIVWLSPLTSLFNLSLGALLVWVLYRGIRRDRTEGWLALPAVGLTIVARFSQVLAVFHVREFFYPFGMILPFAVIADYVTLGLIMVLLLRRFLQGQQERARIRTELQQARSVQEMLIPKHSVQAPGFVIESVYIPASEVGGDFFQVQPGDDGSLLVVVGDVSGKGLKAAMTVSTIVGALRAYPLRVPAEVLANLNRVVHGQIMGFVTCCAALIAADGTMTIANAGHLSPYRNGEEMAVAGGLPLGILAEGSYEGSHYQLGPGDRLTFVSDGVVEATNEKRELFGFDRAQAISNQPAASIAETAKQFGQEDDITVVTVMRTREAIHAV